MASLTFSPYLFWSPHTPRFLPPPTLGKNHQVRSRCLLAIRQPNGDAKSSTIIITHLKNVSIPDNTCKDDCNYLNSIIEIDKKCYINCLHWMSPFSVPDTEFLCRLIHSSLLLLSPFYSWTAWIREVMTLPQVTQPIQMILEQHGYQGINPLHLKNHM